MTKNNLKNDANKLKKKYGIKGMWLVTDDGELYTFDNLASKNHFILEGKVQEQLLNDELLEAAGKRLNKRDDKEVFDRYIG